MSLVSVVCCQVEVSASGWSLVQRSTTEGGVSERDHESLTVKRPWPTGGCCAVVKISSQLPKPFYTSEPFYTSVFTIKACYISVFVPCQFHSSLLFKVST